MYFIFIAIITLSVFKIDQGLLKLSDFLDSEIFDLYKKFNEQHSVLNVSCMKKFSFADFNMRLESLSLFDLLTIVFVFGKKNFKFCFF